MLHWVVRSVCGMMLLFSAIFLSLFIPSDRPVLLEGYFALVFAVLLGLFLTRTPTISINARLFWLWCTVIGLLTALSVFSESRALSLLAVIRAIEGFAAFLIAPIFLRDTRFPQYMAFLGVASSSCFLLLFFFPFFREYVPSYNGVLAVNGHHPVIYTVMMTLPFFFTVPFSPAALRGVISVLTLTVLFSAARIAWMIVSGFFVHPSWSPRTGRNGSAVRLGVIILLVFFGITSLVTASFSDVTKDRIRTAAPILAGFAKDANLVMRREYAQQAFRAFFAKPITGHGPGTFSLVSVAYQSRSGWYSRYAHSFPLELLAETGIVGFVGMSMLMITAVSAAYHAMKTKKYWPYGAAIMLVFVYSLIDVPLQSLPHWILFWALIGVIAPKTTKQTYVPVRTAIIVIWSVLAIFSVSFVSSRLALGQSAESAAYSLAPYDPAVAKEESTKKLTQKERQTILFWHGADTPILIGMAHDDPSLFRRITRLAPKDSGYLSQYLSRLTDTGNTDEIIALLCNPSFNPKNSPCPLTSHKSFRHFIGEKSRFRETLAHLTGNDGHGKFFYFLGLTTYTYTGDREVTLFLWQKAMELSPDWAFYYLEVAGAQFHWFGDTASARQTVNRCLAHPLAYVGCTDTQDITKLLAPGLYSRDIIIIPAIQ